MFVCMYLCMYVRKKILNVTYLGRYESMHIDVQYGTAIAFTQK